MTESNQPLERRAGRKLVVILPCLDEERSVAAVVAGVPREIDGIDEVEVLVVDDGSTDATARRAEEAGATVVRHPRNLGLGTAFRTGVRRALASGADLAVNIDGDGQFDPTHIPLLIAPILSGSAQMATASRFLDRTLIPRMPRLKRWGNSWVAWIVWLITLERFRDVSCGFRAFSREALLRLNLFGTFTYTQETFIDLLFKGLAIEEIPVRVRGTREFGESRIASSIPRYALRSLKIMFRAALGYRPLRFFATLAALFLALGVGLLGFLGLHYTRTGAFSPHIWAGFVGGSFAFLGCMTLVIGFVGDILVRMRLNQEELLYHARRQAYRGVERPAETDSRGPNQSSPACREKYGRSP
jgi:glycosyltransferase involved in cell wall biosynthesis